MVKIILNSFLFWGGWIIIPFIMEIVPALGSVFLLIRRNLRHKLHKKELEVYPEITLIIPVYNSADTLYGCIRSINDSTYPNDRIRIFLVNNKGKDNSFDIYAQCQQEFPELLMQWMNSEQGKSRALNLALYNSDGKYIINLDSDGMLEKNALVNMITRFENYTAIKYDGPVAIVMGAEDTGVSMDNLRICDSMVKIPQFGTIGSLNVSVASSILIYEVVRQRMNEQGTITLLK